MVQKAITWYYDLLDKRLKEGTSIILIISFLIFSVWMLSNGGAYKSNIHEYNSSLPTLKENDIVTIDGITYRVVLQFIDQK